MDIIEPVPSTPGVYALAHPTSKSIFIAYSANMRGRALNWRHVLSVKRDPFWPQGPTSEWVFRVLKQTGGLPRDQVRLLEIQAVERATAKGLTILNPRKWHRVPSHYGLSAATPTTQEDPTT